jgi:Cu+-exporting ATPase
MPADIANQMRAADRTRYAFAVEGMTCAGCAGRVERTLAALPGVAVARVNLAAERAEVEATAPFVSVDQITAAVAGIGYQARFHSSDDTAEERQKFRLRRDAVILTAAAVLTLPLIVPMIAQLFGGQWMLPAAWQFALALPVQLVAGGRFYRGAWHGLRSGFGNMDQLVALGTTAAFVFSLYAWLSGAAAGQLYFETAAVVITLVLMGKFLEARAKRSASQAIRQLMNLRPTTARIETSAAVQDVAIDSVAVGDVVVLRPGERMPVDGRILSGSSEIDEALISGESLPVWRQPGDRVMVGAINGDGLLRLQVEAVGADTTLARIIELVDRAQSGKAPVQKLVDRISAIFVPVVLILALITFAAWMVVAGNLETAMINAVAVLVIACPCALGLATPAAIVVATGTAARHGILIKSVEVLEAARTIDLAVFDKTGTLTLGRPEVIAIETIDTANPSQMLTQVASLQAGSGHPLALAAVSAAEARNLQLLTASDTTNHPGQGITGRVAGAAILIGNQSLLDRFGVVPPAALVTAEHAFQVDGKTTAWVVVDNQVHGLIAMADQLRPTASAAISALRESGVKTHLMSGDRPEVAAHIGDAVAVDAVDGGLLPAEKAAMISAAKTAGRQVAMIGDGINDAPALAVADVSIAIGSGADIALETADVALLRHDLRLVVGFLDLSRACFKTIRQNLFWAFIFNVIGLPLAALGFLSPELAGGAMAASSVMVLLNALMLRRWQPV